MNGVVVYKSNTGFTKKYAYKIGEQLNFSVVPVDDFLKSNIEYDVVVYGGWVMASKIVGLEKVIKKVSLNKLVVFAVGLTPSNDHEVIESIKNQNFNFSEEKIPFYYFQGNVDYEALRIHHRIIVKVMKNNLIKKKDKTITEQRLLDSLSTKKGEFFYDNIYPLIEYVSDHF